MTTLYSVTIQAFPATTDEQKGFIDNKTFVQYGYDNTNTYQESQIKTRGNLRYRTLVDTISMVANPDIQNATAVGADAKTDGTSFTFDVSFQSSGQPTLVVDDEVLFGVDALAEIIAMALIKSYTIRADVFDPTVSTGYPDVLGNYPPEVVRMGDRFELMEVDALAADVDTAKANITITTTEI